MKIINSTNRVIIMGGKQILPGESINVSKDLGKSAAIKSLARVNNITVVEEDCDSEPVSAGVSGSTEAATEAAEGTARKTKGARAKKTTEEPTEATEEE